MKNPIHDKIYGSLIGGAAGDALGYPVEFMSYASIVHKYGAGGITRYELDGKSGKALVSDDTQMTLFTALGLLNAKKCGLPYSSSICRAYAEWVDAFAYRDGKKVDVSVYDGGDDLDDCGMEVQYRVCPDSLGRWKKPSHRIIYDENKHILCIPLDNPERYSTWSEHYVVYKFDGKMFVRTWNEDGSYFTWPFELPE